MMAASTILVFLVSLLVSPFFTCKPKCLNQKVKLKDNLPLSDYIKKYNDRLQHLGSASVTATTSRTQTQSQRNDTLEGSIKCGTLAFDNIDSVLHGHKAAEKSYPWQVSISGEYLTCGGVLISSQWVLTAAHCINNTQRIILGTNDLVWLSLHSRIRSALIEIPHEAYSNTFNDIALIKMNKEVEFSDYIRSACLPKDDNSFEHVRDCYLSGWGLTSVEPREKPRFLQELWVDIIPNHECSRRWYYRGRKITEGHLCTSVNSGVPEGACSGDSGGPISCFVNMAFYVVGVTSFGLKKCTKGLVPDVYTRVSYYRHWIEKKMAEN